jgi:tetratricopeptide (TPR) repeat protein
MSMHTFFRFCLAALICLFTVFAVGQDKIKKASILYELAESAFIESKYSEALELLDQCIRQSPDYMEAYALRGTVREQLKDLDGALTDYSIYLDKFPDNKEVLLNRGLIRYRVGFFQQAKEDFTYLLKLPPSAETNSIFYKQSMSVGDKNPMMTMTAYGNHRSYIYNYLGLTETKLKAYSQAKIDFDSAIRLNPREPDYFVNRGLAKQSMNDSTAQADFQRALSINPNHTLAKHNLSALEAKRLKSMSTEDRLSQTIEADSTMLYPYLERAQQRFESKYYQGAIDDYNRALEIDSSNAEIWMGRGLSRERLKDFKGAFSDYTKAIELKNDFAKGWLNRGNVLVKLERYEDAIEDYSVALIYSPAYSLAFYNRAMAKVKLKRNDEACTDLNQAESLGMKVDGKVKNKVCIK